VKYRVIVADPPWRAAEQFSKTAGRARKHYPAMTNAELCALPVRDLAEDDAILLLWVTWPQVKAAFNVISAWGFEYVTGFPWVKLCDDPFVDMFGNLIAHPVYGTGQWVRGCSEPIFICKRGTIPRPSTNFLGLLGKRMEHSRKPDTLYEYAEAFPGPYLEMFARRTRLGWDVWGNEVASDPEVSSTLSDLTSR
jgi:N6-adenosine-specific RNA methylase IME4